MGMKARMERMAQQYRAMVAIGCHFSETKLHEFS